MFSGEYSGSGHLMQCRLTSDTKGTAIYQQLYQNLDTTKMKGLAKVNSWSIPQRLSVCVCVHVFIYKFLSYLM